MSRPCNGWCVFCFVLATILFGVGVWLAVGDSPNRFMQELEVVEFNARAKRLEAAKQQACGDITVWVAVDVDDKTIRCVDKKGQQKMVMKP